MKLFLKKHKLYPLLIIGLVLGYAWVYYLYTFKNSEKASVTVCQIKTVTGFPCPSCGTTRSVVSLLQGDVIQAIYTNPIGIVITGLMVILPIWIAVDFFRKSRSLFINYIKLEALLKKKSIAIPLILLVLFNWIWNIMKEL